VGSVGGFVARGFALQRHAHAAYPRKPGIPTKKPL
jgi:hypothetical protein